jgi:hypothetical protein
MCGLRDDYMLNFDLPPAASELDYDPGQWLQNGIVGLFYQQVPSSSNAMASLEWNWRA